MMVSGTKKAMKEPTRTKLSSVSRQFPFLKTLEWSLSPSTGIGIEMPAEREGSRRKCQKTSIQASILRWEKQ